MDYRVKMFKNFEKKFAKNLQNKIFGVPLHSQSKGCRQQTGGNSSVGRAQPCQGWGREFESRFPLKIKSQRNLRLFCFCAFQGKIAPLSTCGKVLLLQLSNKSKQIIGGKQGVMHEISCNLCTKSILVVKVSARSP